MKTYLDVPWEDRLTVKACGAKWDPARKQWYCPDAIDLTPMLRWLPKEKLPQPKTKKERRQMRRIDAVLKGGNHKQTSKREL